jgi:glycolate oxidase
MHALLKDPRHAGDVTTDPDVLESYRHDEAAPGLLEAGMPALLVRPRTTAEVQAAVCGAARHGMPVVSRGAGSGLSGGANAVQDCLLLSLERMAGPVDVDAASLTATVPPGVINNTLREAAAARERQVAAGTNGVHGTAARARDRWCAAPVVELVR